MRFDLVQCPLPSESVDAVILLNVLEHIEQDAAAAAHVARILRPGGVAVVEVPAGPHLYDAYDKYLQHFRRYRLTDLCRLLQGQGLHVELRSHLGFFLYPAFAVVKRRNQRLLGASDDEQRHMVAANISQSSNSRLLRWSTRVEEHLSRYVSYPIGIRCVAVARKLRASAP